VQCRTCACRACVTVLATGAPQDLHLWMCMQLLNRTISVGERQSTAWHHMSPYGSVEIRKLASRAVSGSFVRSIDKRTQKSWWIVRMWVVAMPLFVNFSPDQQVRRWHEESLVRVCASLRLPDTYSVLQESAVLPCAFQIRTPYCKSQQAGADKARALSRLRFWQACMQEKAKICTLSTDCRLEATGFP
jgi:hypothetical protein